MRIIEPRKILVVIGIEASVVVVVVAGGGRKFAEVRGREETNFRWNFGRI